MKIQCGSIQRKGRMLYYVVRTEGRIRWFSLKTGDIEVARIRARAFIPQSQSELEWLRHLKNLGRDAEQRLRVLNAAKSVNWDNLGALSLPVVIDARCIKEEPTHTRWLEILHQIAMEKCQGSPSELTPSMAAAISDELSARYVSCRRMVSFYRRCWQAVGLDDSIWDLGPQQSRNLAAGSRSREFYRRLSLAEASSIYEYLRENDQDMSAVMAIGFGTGLRLSDVTELEASEIADGGKFLRIVPNKTRLKKPRPLIIPLIREAGEAIKARMTEKGYIFPDSVRNRPSRRLANAFRRCGVMQIGAGRASFHSLRATFISMMDEAGIPPHITDAITGHGGGGMHSRYTQPSLSALRDSMMRAIPPLCSDVC